MKWVRIEDERPKHHHTVLAANEKGICVCIFVDAIQMNINLLKNGFPADQSNNQYYFASQEKRGNVVNGITHWMKDLELPC